jgi:hypothetical protein
MGLPQLCHLRSVYRHRFQLHRPAHAQMGQVSAAHRRVILLQGDQLVTIFGTAQCDRRRLRDRRMERRFYVWEGRHRSSEAGKSNLVNNASDRTTITVSKDQTYGPHWADCMSLWSRTEAAAIRVYSAYQGQAGGGDDWRKQGSPRPHRDRRPI